ncbi:unnamed protein product [Caenorhabditis brenneri]
MANEQRAREYRNDYQMRPPPPPPQHHYQNAPRRQDHYRGSDRHGANHYNETFDLDKKRNPVKFVCFVGNVIVLLVIFFHSYRQAAYVVCQKKDKRCFNSYFSWTPGRNNGQPIAPIFQSTPKQSSVSYKYPSWRNNPPGSAPRNQSSDIGYVHLRLIDLELNDAPSSSNTSHNRSLRSTLPVWAIDEQGGVAGSVTLKEVLANESLIEFTTDKNGWRFLQEQYPIASDGGIHDEIFRKMVEDRERFLSMCRNMFDNFFVQRMVECSNPEEQEIVMEHLITDMFALCMDERFRHGTTSLNFSVTMRI